MNIRKKFYNNYFTYGQYVVEPNTNPFPHFVRNRKNQLGVISVFGTMVQIPFKY